MEFGQTPRQQDLEREHARDVAADGNLGRPLLAPGGLRLRWRGRC